MLKKAGLLVAASAASIVALSPLAFATDEPAPGNQNSSGVVNGLNGNNLNAPIEACNNDIQGQVGLVPVQDVGENPTVPLNGAAGLLGGEAKAHQDANTANTRACGQEDSAAGYSND